jgi:hypothetical protein
MDDVRSMFNFTVLHDKDAKHIIIALSMTTDIVNGASCDSLDEPTVNII